MEENKIKAIKSSASFNVPFTGIMYSRLVDLYIYIAKLESESEMLKTMQRISQNDQTISPNDHAYHLQTIMAFMQIIDKAADDQQVSETMSEEEFKKQTKERLD